MGIVKLEPKKKKKPKRKHALAGPAQTAGEAIERILQEKKISSKINYDVLNDLNKASEPKNATTAVAPGPADSTASQAAADSTSSAKPQSTALKRKHTPSATLPSQEPVGKADKTDVIVESGPVHFDREEHAEEEEEEEEEAEDDEPVSAATLLGHASTADDEYNQMYAEFSDND